MTGRRYAGRTWTATPQPPPKYPPFPNEINRRRPATARRTARSGENGRHGRAGGCAPRRATIPALWSWHQPPAPRRALPPDRPPKSRRRGATRPAAHPRMPPTSVATGAVDGVRTAGAEESDEAEAEARVARRPAPTASQLRTPRDGVSLAVPHVVAPGSASRWPPTPRPHARVSPTCRRGRHARREGSDPPSPAGRSPPRRYLAVPPR
jgi:hypothetical protein